MPTVKKILGFVFRYGIIAWIAAAMVWFYIINTMRDGISCDEGYYLMGFLRGQNIEGQGSDFHSIVRALCFAFPDNDIMIYRYMRLALNVVALVLFALTSYRWLSKRHDFSASRWAYYPMVALSGAMSFTFAAPTISYDSLEVIIAMFATSMLFVQLSSDKMWIKHLAAVGLGFSLWYVITNYPSAGVCLLVLLAIVFFLESGRGKWKGALAVLLGFGLGILINHLFVHDLRLWFPEVKKLFISTFTETSMSRHDSGSLVSGMLLTVAKQASILFPIVLASLLLFKKVRMPEWLSWGVVIVSCVFLLVFRKVYELRGTLMMIPVALMLGQVLARKDFKIGHYLITKDFWLVFVWVAVPLAGVFGTNQAMIRKAIMFTPFWLLSFYQLSAKVESNGKEKLNLIFLTILFAAYFYLGNFQRYQYYYTPRSSKYELIGASRTQHIRVSKYQQEYYSDLFDSLRVAGCRPGDHYMAFEEDLMAVYLAGGYIEGRLPYHWWQCEQMDSEAPKAFILFKSEEENVLDHFKSANWDFPAAYRRMEMRQASENMGDELRTVIYVRQAVNSLTK